MANLKKIPCEMYFSPPEIFSNDCCLKHSASYNLSIVYHTCHASQLCRGYELPQLGLVEFVYYYLRQNLGSLRELPHQIWQWYKRLCIVVPRALATLPTHTESREKETHYCWGRFFGLLLRVANEVRMFGYDLFSISFNCNLKLLIPIST